MVIMPVGTIRISSRKSALALWQANHIAALLSALPERPQTELVLIETSGDRNQTDSLQQFGGTGVFTKEVQRAVLDGRADLAVHSLKDLPTVSAEGLTLGCIPDRASRYDALLLPSGSVPLTDLSELPVGSRIGTGSPRRCAQLWHHRPDLNILEIRGNVDTRLRKLDDGQFDAISLAEAGLIRLGLADRISLRLAPPVFFPAVSQGALGLECRTDDDHCQNLIRQLSCTETTFQALAERSLLRTLRAGCHAPLGVWAECSRDSMTLHGVLLSIDGKTRIEAEVSCDDPSEESAETLGSELAQQLVQKGAEALLVRTTD